MTTETALNITSSIATKATYTGSVVAVGSGVAHAENTLPLLEHIYYGFTVTEWGVFVGITSGVIGAFLQWYTGRKKLQLEEAYYRDKLAILKDAYSQRAVKLDTVKTTPVSLFPTSI